MNKKFARALRPDLKVSETRRHIEVRGGGLGYRVDQRGAGRAQAELINSKIPVATLRPPTP